MSVWQTGGRAEIQRRADGMAADDQSYIAASFHIEKEDFELSPFDAKGGLGKMWQLFGEQMEPILNEALAA
jgi:hypothetical protein